MKIVPFEPMHIERLREEGIQPSQVMEVLSNDVAMNALSKQGVAFSVIDGDRVLFCGGVVEMWKGRGLAWSVFPQDVGHLFIGVHRAVKRWLRDCKIRRIEADIRTDFLPAHRWAKMLGFRYEGTRRAYCPLGNDYDLYARVVRVD